MFIFMRISVGNTSSGCCRENEEIVGSCLGIEMTKELYSGLE